MAPVEFEPAFPANERPPTHDLELTDIYEGWNFNSGNYLFTTDTK